MSFVLRRLKPINVAKICTRSLSLSARKRKDNLYDVVIVGGGMVGGSLACSLGSEESLSGIKVLLLEAAPKKTYELPSNFENRVSSITPGSKDLLEKIGAWEHVSNMRMKPYKRMQVWDACGDGHIAFDTAPYDVSSATDMAYMVENSVITAALDKQLEKLQENNIEIMHSARIKSISTPDPVWNVDEQNYKPWVQVQMNDGTTINTRLLVGADGAKSTVRSIMDTDYLSWSYKQFGVVATLELAEVTKNLVAWQKFLPTGPMALLPLSENVSSLVWSTTPEHAKTLVNLPDDAFIDAVNDGFWEDQNRSSLVESASQVGHMISSFFQPSDGTMSKPQVPPSISKLVPGSRAMFPLAMGHSTNYVQKRIALIGDAAHRIHPLAGQGVNLGFGDVICLTEKVVQAAQNGQDVGDISHLLEYETQRQRAVVPMIIATDLLKRLFSTSSNIPTAARTAGLLAVNGLPIKDQIISFARR